MVTLQCFDNLFVSWAMLEQYYCYFYYYYRDYNNYLHNPSKIKVLQHKRAKKCVKQACAWEFLRFLFIPGVDRPTDACEEGTHTCDIPERAQCSYRGGSSYVCSCLPGFVGDGRICEGTARGRVNISRSVCVKLAFHRDEVREVTGGCELPFSPPLTWQFCCIDWIKLIDLFFV